MKATVANMTKMADQPFAVFCYCTRCGEHFSATPGDYFMVDPDTALKCHGKNMILARKESTIIEL